MTPESPVLEAAIGTALGRTVTIARRTRLAGGDISVVERLATDAGSFVVKSGPAPAGLFRAEADGLLALRESGTTLRIPAVVAGDFEGPAFLVLEDLGGGSPGAGFDEALGEGLAALHRAGAASFGFASDGFCGATPQPNPWTPDWVEFYGRARLGHQLERGVATGQYSNDDRRHIEALIDRLHRWLTGPPEGPALIHGDLWSGNVLAASDGRPAIIDPAAYYGHREAELGMMTLFGGFGSRVYDAYGARFPLEPGWRDRTPLYQLYHLMNHVTLFGRSYHAAAMAIVYRFAG